MADKKETLVPATDENVLLAELTKENESLKKEREVLLRQAQNGVIASKALETANTTISNILNTIEMYKNYLELLNKGGK